MHTHPRVLHRCRPPTAAQVHKAHTPAPLDRHAHKVSPTRHTRVREGISHTHRLIARGQGRGLRHASALTRECRQKADLEVHHTARREHISPNRIRLGRATSVGTSPLTVLVLQGTQTSIAPDMLVKNVETGLAWAEVSPVMCYDFYCPFLPAGPLTTRIGSSVNMGPGLINKMAKAVKGFCKELRPVSWAGGMQLLLPVVSFPHVDADLRQAEGLGSQS